MRGLLLALLLALPSAAHANDCEFVWGNFKAQTRTVLEDTRLISLDTGRTLAWRVSGEALALAAKLANAEQDVLHRRARCADEQYKPVYVAVPSFKSAPPPAMTLAEIQLLLSGAIAQVEGKLADLDMSYLPCTQCITDSATLKVITPLAIFVEEAHDNAAELFPATAP